jgi:hypothetical protein
MLDRLLHARNLNLAYARCLVADVPAETMAFQPVAGMNHAARVLGHLACTGDMFGGLIGLQPVCPTASRARSAGRQNFWIRSKPSIVC